MSFGGDSPFDVLILSGESNSKYPQISITNWIGTNNIYQHKRISNMNTDYYNQIIDIAKESLANKRQDWEYYEELLKYTPTGSEFKDAPKTYEDFKTILPIGRYRKSHLVGMLQLVGKYEKVTRKDTYNPIFISTTSQSMLDMYGNKMNVSRALKLAADIYLIEKVNPKYRFNANKYSYP